MVSVAGLVGYGLLAALTYGIYYIVSVYAAERSVRQLRS